MADITFQGEPVHTHGQLPPVGGKAPDFTVTKLDLSEIHLKNYAGKKIILNIFPSLDTSTCASTMLEFNKIAIDHPDYLILCISADLPFAQKRFCAAEHLANVLPVSVYRHPKFGEDYGVYITDSPLTGLLARAVIVIDEQGKITYTELIKEIVDEPDYTALLAHLNKQI